jgi:hypothetical protein
VFECGLDDKSKVSPAEAKDFSSNLCVQTDSGAYQAFCPIGTGVPFPGRKEQLGHDADPLTPT